MKIRNWALAPLALLLTGAACAQAAAPAKPDAKSEAEAAMERAKRQAAGPMRVILEASKGKRKAGEAEPPAAAADTGSVRTVASRAAPVPAVEPSPRVTATTVEPTPAPVVTTAPPPGTAPAGPVASPVSTQITLNSEALQGRAVNAVPALQNTTASASAPIPLPAAPTAALPKLADSLAKPKLVSRVDPDIPQRTLDELGRNAAVLVDLDIRADGAVGSAAVVGNVPLRVQRAVVTAVQQWRFEPLPGNRSYRVELIFNAD